MESAAPRRSILLRAPAIQALVIQCATLAFLVLLLGVIDVHASSLTFVLLQGALAALITYWRRMATWWVPIQFLFPLASSATHALALPPSLFLAGFMLLLGLFWSTFRTQVPLYLSGKAAWQCVDNLLPREQPLRFLDIGSGLGGLVLHLGRLRPESSFSGIEIAPLPWLASWLRARIARNGSQFMRGDYDRLDFAEYDVIFAYLSPAAMPAVWQKAVTQMRPGTLLLSYEFGVPDAAPDVVLQTGSGGRMLYGWRM